MNQLSFVQTLGMPISRIERQFWSKYGTHEQEYQPGDEHNLQIDRLYHSLLKPQYQQVKDIILDHCLIEVLTKIKYEKESLNCLVVTGFIMKD